jgi:hypothetical protein
MKEIIDKGVTPDAKLYLKDYVKEENPYVIWYFIANYPIPLFRYINEDGEICIETIEAILILEDCIEIYKSITRLLSISYHSKFNWNIADVYDDDKNFDINDIIQNNG